MKKLLELLGIILITSNAAGPLAANKPNNNKDKIKNSLETLTRQKRQAPPAQTDIIEKEITLDKNYSDNIQKMLKDFMKNNQIDPLRMINNEGIVTTDKFETLAKIKERDANIKIIEKLDEILQLREFDANKIRILILTLKNSDKNKEIKLVINLDNLYLQGFINKNNQYFYFKEEKSFEQWNQEKKKIEDQLNEWKILEEKFNSLSLNDEIKNKIKEIDNFKDESKRKLNQENSEENKKIIRLIQNNSFTEIEKSCQDDEIKQKILKLKPFWNIYQKIQQIRQKALNLLNKGKSEIKKEYEEKIKNYQWNSIFNEINSIIQSNISTIQHKKIKENEINKIIAKKYSINKNQLNYNGSYQNKGLNAVNQNINITKENLNKIIANLSNYTHDSTRTEEEIQTIKNKLVRLIFITSEAMRFGSYLKCFNYEKNGQKVEFKNIPTNVQEILDGKIDSLKWKDYEDQLIGGWIASSKNLEQKRKEIFKKLNKRIIVSNFLSEHNKELNKIFKKSSKQSQNWETEVKSDVQKIIKNSNNQEYINLETYILKNINDLFIANEKEINFLKQWDNNRTPSVININKMDTYYNLIRSVIVQGNLDLFELIITKEPELINVNNNDLTFLQVAIANNKIDIVKWLLANANGANVNEEGKYDSTPLYTATFYGYLDIVKLLLENGADVNARAKNVNIPLHVAIDRGYLDIVSLLLNNGANVNRKNNNGEPPLSTTIIFLGNLDIVKLLLEKGADVNIKDNFGQSPLHLAAHKGHLEIIKLLLAKGADVNAQDIKGITPLQKATDEGHTEVINLLENFVKIKNKIKSLNKQLEKTQNDGQKTKIKNDLQEIQKELEQLLKIKLSDFITQTQLGKIPDNSSQTILNAFIEKNEKIKKLGILSGQLYVQNITDNSADIISPAPNVYTGTVKVTFTLAKKSSKPSNTQKTITEDEYKKQGGARPKGSTVASKQSDNKKSSITNVSGAGIPQQNSGTQNKKARVTNQNNLYDVPADGSCLFWSVATSYLVPVRNNNEEFRNRFIQLFGELQLSYLSYVQTLLQQFDLSNTNNFLQSWYQDATAHRLVRVVFRNRVVDYIERNLDNPTQSNANGKQAESFLSAIQISENEVVNNYLDRMRNINAWGGEIEILAMNNLLNANISVGIDIPYQPVNQNSNNNNIAIY